MSDSFQTITAPVTEIVIDDTTQDSNNKGKRIAAAYQVCCISKSSGITINGHSVQSETLSYEIWDEAGADCLATFSEEPEFVDYFFIVPSPIQFRLVQELRTYVGYK